MRLVLATRNAHKVRELGDLLPGHTIVPLGDDVVLPPETGSTCVPKPSSPSTPVMGSSASLRLCASIVACWPSMSSALMMRPPVTVSFPSVPSRDHFAARWRLP